MKRLFAAVAIAFGVFAIITTQNTEAQTTTQTTNDKPTLTAAQTNYLSERAADRASRSAQRVGLSWAPQNAANIKHLAYGTTYLRAINAMEKASNAVDKEHQRRVAIRREARQEAREARQAEREANQAAEQTYNTSSNSSQPSSGGLPALLLTIRANESGGNYSAYNATGCEGYGCGGAFQLHALYASTWAARAGYPRMSSNAATWPPAIQDAVALDLFYASNPDGAMWCSFSEYC